MTTTEDVTTTVGERHWTGAPRDSRWLAAAETLAAEVAPGAASADESGSFVHGGFALLRERGFMSMLVPSDLGGGGATHAEACAVLATLSHGCPATSLALSMHTHLIAAQVWRHKRDL